ncbi:hypothetical protein N6H18_04090 [Reichenbachiella agarivorans]|uniref:Self-protective colicin-like immunity n=1 Tax=Reichenbachiella agarivorans TaxID=2979464 RepID=A0ABY6CUS8_9BACT|nr:hypothetical protein [Reichenbachiella agarivorans]UXP33133.1 hypothetical protein N6H18_04090 [Reichenbachiella agarivorans]
MKLPIIKHTLAFIHEHDEDWVHETIDFLEHMADAKGIKDEEVEVIAELLSNMYGALEVNKEIKSGTPEKDALNGFMSRVMGSIGK